ncbi:GbsR/MarR family transcriptional regulator [Streptomyces ovatisporus]|uniref:GbsR/MarR family transcriptional regulator n=1 Tax=Streptomyces ovatisporus TaxID=1128682 RepID=A0ABV9AA48_9ACTN
MTKPAPDVDRDQVLDWVERVSMYLAQDGVPPIAGRVLGWLMICDPPEQSAGQIAEAIGASRASLTTNLRMLTTMGFVGRHTRPGERTVYHRIVEGASEKVIRRQIAGIASFCDITADGLALLGPDSARAARIREAHQAFEWMAKAFENAPPITPGTQE